MKRLQLFWALSRTPHGLLDMSTPAFAALLWLGRFPPWPVVVLGLVTTFAGYTAVYALNDLVDYRSDRQKAAAGGFAADEAYLDGVFVRHPMAQGLLSFRAALGWAAGWGAVALAGAFLLNPVCVLIFLGGCVAEAVYCLLWRVSPWRAVVSGAVKSTGALAAVFAVDPRPDGAYLLVLFMLLFCWEIGGQNIPADWTDFEADRRLGGQTIPVRLGLERSRAIALASLAAAVLLAPAVGALGRQGFSWAFALPALAAGAWLLLVPAAGLYRSRNRQAAMRLFNRASWFPPSLLAAVLIHLLAGAL